MAALLVPVAQSSDGGGSSRIPASANGLLDAIGGPDLLETLVAPAKARPYAEELGRDPGRLRIGLGIPPADRFRARHQLTR